MSNLTFDVLASTRVVCERSEFVSIDHGHLLAFAEAFDDQRTPHWLAASEIGVSRLDDRQKLEFLLLFNSLSFSYWGDPKWAVTYRGTRFDGSWAMVACILRAVEAGVPILDPRYRVRLSREEFAKIFEGNVEIPLLDERFVIMREIASGLLERAGGDVVALVARGNGDAPTLLKHILYTFPSFYDASVFDGCEVAFHKRAQLLVADIFQLFAGKGYGDLKRIDWLTACADYKLPQCLRALGIFLYHEDLAARVDAKIPLVAGSREEIEIRANTIWVVEKIRRALVGMGKDVPAILINDLLWLASQDLSREVSPYHRTRTTAY